MRPERAAGTLKLVHLQIGAVQHHAELAAHDPQVRDLQPWDRGEVAPLHGPRAKRPLPETPVPSPGGIFRAECESNVGFDRYEQ